MGHTVASASENSHDPPLVYLYQTSCLKLLISKFESKKAYTTTRDRGLSIYHYYVITLCFITLL